MASSLEARYKKAYKELEEAATVYYPLLQKHREALGNGKLLDTPGLDAASSRFYKAIQDERRLAQKLQDKVKRDIGKIPLPEDLVGEIKDYAGLTDTVKPPVLPAAQKLGITGGRKTRKGGRRHKKTRRA